MQKSESLPTKQYLDSGPNFSVSLQNVIFLVRMLYSLSESIQIAGTLVFVRLQHSAISTTMLILTGRYKAELRFTQTR